MTRFPSLTVETAPEPARRMLTASSAAFGFVPAPVARAAHAPVALAHLLAGFAAFDRTSLSELEREVVAMAVAFEQGCHYCMAMHSSRLAREPAHADVLAALRAGTPLPDGRLEAVRSFARAVVRERGQVPAAGWATLATHGLGEAQALEIVLGVGVYLLSTLLNLVTDAPLDPAFAAHAWHPPRGADAAV